MNQATMQTPTLGARIRAILEEEQMHPLEAARKAAQRKGGDTIKHFEIIEALFDRIKAAIEADVTSGLFPRPVRLSREEESALGTCVWYNWPEKKLNKSHAAFQVQVAFEAWAKEQELNWVFVQGHDGGGRDSWWDFVVPRPAAAPKGTVKR